MIRSPLLAPPALIGGASLARGQWIYTMKGDSPFC